ncbi:MULTISPECIES: MIP/aquaporin family protein [unclassified Nonomuraea]|uniref:MIP/aquaporin family protein n=1 Tax=unclassified Nonomuraea TaxID=2593643 RepID=UPI0033F2ED73
MTPLPRRLLAEFLGTALLVTVVVGSGVMAQTLSPHDVGLQLLENSTATVFGLAVLIVVLGPVSGAHLNPVVSLADWWQGRRSGIGLRTRELGAYIAAQLLGGISGAVLANAMFDRPAITWSAHDRAGAHLWLGEVVATAGLLLVIFSLTRSGRTTLAPVAVGGYIGAAYWFTSSTSFANPAVTIGRAFSDTFAGIAPTSVPGFVAAQLVGGAVGLLLVRGLFGRAPAGTPEPVFPHPQRRKGPTP